MPDGRILIADDEDSLRWVLEKGFRGAGYQVTAVKDGTAALREVQDGPFDLILLDIRMPGIDGLSLLKQVRAGRPDAQVVIMTAHGTMETAVAAMQDGAYDYLAKPFDLDEALLLAERALTARRLTREEALKPEKPSVAWPVCCSIWFGPVASPLQPRVVILR